MTNEVSENFIFYGIAKEIWVVVRETYAKTDNTAKIFKIKTILHDLR